MSRDGLPRAYLRMSPDLDQHPDPLAMVRAMCAAARQPKRGRFRDEKVLERAVGRRQYREMVQRGDVVLAPEGLGIYLDGWDEWQEGDYTVAERMRRMRARRHGKVTPRSSPRRNAVTTDAVDELSLGAVDDGDADDSPPPQAGRRRDGTNPRARGTNPRANGTSPRQVKAAEKRAGLPPTVAEILRQANEAGRP